MSRINIFWFRRDLRIQDNVGLFHCSESELPFLPVFIFDDSILENISDKSDKRVSFIHDNLQLIKEQFQENASDLRVHFGTPDKVFRELINKYDIHNVYANEDYEPYAIKRDDKIEKLLCKNGIGLKLFKDQCIFHKDNILKKDNNPYTMFTPYKNKWLSLLNPSDIASFNSKKNIQKALTLEPENIITLREIGFEQLSDQKYPRVLKRRVIEEYGSKRDLLELNATSKLGVHLRFGTVSIRKCVQVALEFNEKTWLSQLIWRDFFMQILYHFPYVESKEFKSKYEGIEWRNSEKDFKKWCSGNTGYPLVDAGMRELNKTGFMHNRARMIVASFLVKHLLIDWQWGEKYFSEKLLDYDLSANNGNWQWVAGTGCDSSPYFRIFNPYTQQKKFDPELKYIKKWIPEFGTKDYVEPMVDHKYAYNRALLTYKKALKKS